jgi:nucleoside-diphosphate-sugar epimerase
MRTLVTGGAGFIGSHLAEALAARGDEVTVLDDLSTGREENLRILGAGRGFRFVRGDIREHETVARAAEGCGAVFHLAAAVGVRLIVEQPVRSIETNIHGTENVLRLAADRGLPVLIASSSEVYGKGVRCPFAEDDDIVLGPTTVTRWSYAAGKAVDEFLALAHHKEHGTRAVIARFFNTVGPRQVGRYGMVIPRFVEQALGGGPISVYGDGTQTRCFGYVGEVVRACIALLETPAASGRVFNVGSPHEVSVNDLAEKVRALVDPSCAIERIPFEVAYGPGFEDLDRRVPSVERLKKTIGFTPEKRLDEFLPEIVADVRARKAGA